ncbi:MAG: hypothetical protein EBS05_16255 [Proteobacteria bacterium]|nr:hypothetical protein [Pseudomonadota bacterium]
MNRSILFASRLVAALVLPLSLAGCSLIPHQAKVPAPGPRAFDFATDTLAVPLPDPSSADNREALAEPALRAHVNAHVARQFFLHARFEPAQPPPTTTERAALVRTVLKRSPKEMSPDNQRVVIPGYANLRELSQLQGHLVRAESWIVCGCENQASLINKGFNGGHDKDAVVSQLLEATGGNRPALVRLYRHHELKFNRSLLVFGAQNTEGEVRFSAYDPATPKQPVQLTFNRVNHVFSLSDDAANSGPTLGVELRR